MTALQGEDAKLVLLARAARSRAYPRDLAPEGAAVRDSDGRTYSAATVAHISPQLATSALRGAVIAAVSSGARSFESAVIVSDATSIAPADLAVLGEFGFNVPVHLVSPAGDLLLSTTS